MGADSGITPLADKINKHLESDGVLQVTTHLKSTLYSKKHAGWFFMLLGSLYVQSGNKKLCLSHGSRLLVSMRFGRMAQKTNSTKGN